MPACKLDILRQHVREPAITVAVPAKGLVFQRVFEQAVQKRRARGVVTVALQRRRVFQQLRQNERNNFLRPLPELFIRRAVLNRIILIECVRFFNRLQKCLQQLFGCLLWRHCLRSAGCLAFHHRRALQGRSLALPQVRLVLFKRRLQRRRRKRGAAAGTRAGAQPQCKRRGKQQRQITFCFHDGSSGNLCLHSSRFSCKKAWLSGKLRIFKK